MTRAVHNVFKGGGGGGGGVTSICTTVSAVASHLDLTRWSRYAFFRILSDSLVPRRSVITERLGTTLIIGSKGNCVYMTWN